MSALTPLRIRLPFRSEDEFVDHYGAHVGRDGFFLATRGPKPVGTQLLFDLVLADGRSLLRGEGVVVRSSPTGERPGMTLRFVRLETAGKALVERIVAGRPARGPASSEARAHPSAWAPPAGPSAAPSAPPRERTPRHAGPESWAPPTGPGEPEPPLTEEAQLVPEAEPAPPVEVFDTSRAATGVSAPPEVPSTEVFDTSRADTSRAATGVSAPPEVPSTEVFDTSRGDSSRAATEVPVPRDVPPSEVSETSPADTAAERSAPTEVSDTSAEEAPAGLAADAAPTTAGDVTGASRESGEPAPTSPPLDDSELPELVVTEFKGPGRLRPAGLEHTPASADVHAALTPPAGTLVVTELDEPPPEPRFKLDAPVRGDEPLHVPESSFHEVAEALSAPVSIHDRPTAPIPLLPSMETAPGEEVPIPPPPPKLDEAVPEEGALRLEPGSEPPTSGPAVPSAIPLDVPAKEFPPPPVETLPPEAHEPVASAEPAAAREAAVAPPPGPAPAPTGTPPAAREAEVAPPPAPAPAPTGAPPGAREAEVAPPPAPAPTPIPTPAVAREAEVAPRPAPAPAPTRTPARGTALGTVELGIEVGPESVRIAWFHDGRAELLTLDPERSRHHLRVRLVREPGAAPRVLPPDAAEPALWAGAPLPFLGARADSDASRTVARRWPAAVVPDDRGEAAFALEGGTVGATELVATLLRWVRHRTEELTSHHAGRVVLAVPVSYNTLQRERLREAAERAGFERVRLVQAPTAATMAFAHGRGLARRRILVWRMGASTCDVAVLAASGDDLDMVACAGDAFVGSMNFDEQIALTLDKATRADGAVLRRRISEAGQLQARLEDPSIDEAFLEGGARLSRSELEMRTTALVERGVLLAREVLRSASLTPQALDELVLVGSATRLPHVRRMVEGALGMTARTEVDATSAVCMGAATLAHLLAPPGPKSASRTALHEVLGVPLEIIAPELGQVRVLDRNTRLPAEKTLTLTLGLGAPLEVQVFQGPARAPDPRSFLGLLRAPADRAGDWTLHLALDTDGVLRAAATNPSGKRHALQLQVPASAAEAEQPPSPRVPSEPETPAAPVQPPGLLGGLKRLFGRR